VLPAAYHNETHCPKREITESSRHLATSEDNEYAMLCRSHAEMGGVDLWDDGVRSLVAAEAGVAVVVAEV
jgi:hypothetical protein